MKKFWLIFWGILLIACNLPVGKTTPSPDTVSTMVASTLDSQSTATVASTPQQPTQTALPTQTMQPTTTFTPTPTNSPEDPRELLGEPSQVTFNTSWYLEDDDHTIIDLKDNKLVMTSIQPVGWYTWSIHPPRLGDHYLEAKIHVKQCSGNDSYGMIFRAGDDYASGYFVGLTCDGKYNLRTYDQNAFRNLVEWTQSDAVLSGSDQTNRLGVKSEGSRLTIYINGKMIKEVQDSTFSNGMFGFFISGNATPNFTIEVETLDYWKF
jgi:hypothetical protein